MAIPTNPTAVSIGTEALVLAGHLATASDFAAKLTRATDYYLETIKNDIMNRALMNGNTRLKSLQSENVQISVIGQSKYDMAADFDEEISIEVLDGSISDTAQAGGNTTITLAAASTITADAAEGKYILITSGLGVNGLRQIVDYDTGTNVATVDRAWDTNPDATSVYRIIDSFNNIGEGHIEDLNDSTNRTSKGLPTEFYKINEGVNTRIIFDKPTDKATYGIRVRYYANIHNIDLTEGSTLISQIYKSWRTVLTQGVYMKQLEEDNDDRYAISAQQYERMVQSLIVREIPYGGEFEGFAI